MNIGDFDQFMAMVVDIINALDDAEVALALPMQDTLVTYPDGRRERIGDLRKRCIEALTLDNRR